MSTTLRAQIVRAAYEGRQFPCLEFQDTNAHSFVEHKAWRVDGADIQSTGREPLKISCKIALLTSISGWPDDLFPRLHDELDDLFRSTPQGMLTHPYYGETRVQVASWKRSFDPAMQQGVVLDVEFVETNASAYRSFANFDPEPGTALSDAATAADDAIAAYDPNTGIDSLADVTATQLAYLEEEDRSADEAYAALGVIQRAAQTALDSAALAAIEAHDARAALREVLARSWSYASKYLTPRATPRIYVVPVTMSLQRIAATVYGSASRTVELRKANRVPDELFVPAGTVLVLPEAS